MSPFFNCLIAQTEQDFSKQYEFILMNNDYHDAQFTCLTERQSSHGGASQLYVGGSLRSPSDEWMISLVRIELNGNAVAKRAINPAGEDGKYVPTGILFERLAVSNYEMLTVCGYIDNPGTGHAFVLRYNFTTSTLEWMTQLEDGAAFFDIQNFNDDFIVCGHQMVDYQVASTFIVDKISGAISRYEQFEWDNMNVMSSDSYYALEVNNETDEIALSSRIDYGFGVGPFYRMKPAISILDNLALHTYDRMFFGTATSETRLYAFDIAWNTTNNILYTIVSGDVDGGTENADPYIIKHNTITNVTDIRHFDFVEDYDGKLNSLKLYSKPISLPDPTVIKNNPIIYGCKAENDILGDVYLLRLNASLTLEWGRTYSQIFQPATTPNSMILVGNTVYAVGAKTVDGHDNGVLIASPIITDPSICGEIYEPELQTPDPIVYDPNLQIMDLEMPQTEVEITQNSIYINQPYLCGEPEGAPRTNLISSSESLIISRLNDQNVEVKISGAIETSDYRIQIVNLLGQVIIDKQMEDDHSLIVNMEIGIYIGRLFKDGVQIDTLKFISN